MKQQVPLTVLAKDFHLCFLLEVAMPTPRMMGNSVVSVAICSAVSVIIPVDYCHAERFVAS